MHNFLYSLTICLLHYYPRHVSSINMPIFRRKNCIHTASGIFALRKRLHSTLVDSGLSPLSTSVLCRRLQRAKIPDAVCTQFFLLKMGMLMLETFEDNSVTNILLMNKENCALKLVDEIILCIPEGALPSNKKKSV